jgi:hypothetical protein
MGTLVKSFIKSGANLGGRMITQPALIRIDDMAVMLFSAQEAVRSP